MATHRVSLMVLLLASICLAPAQIIGADQDDGKKPLPPGTLSGRVVDPEGKPVSGARVWINTWESKLLAEARSDADGRFRLGPAEPVYRHPFPILIEAEGYARQYSHLSMKGSYSIFPGADCDLGEIRLARGRVFTGQLIDIDGTPYRDAEVTAAVYIHELGNTIGHLGPDYHLKTDSNGRFRTAPLPVGGLSVWTQPPNRQLAYVGCPVAPDGEQVLNPLRLERDVPLDGIVKDQLGHPIAGVAINANVECRTTSDSLGRFTLHGWGPKPQFQFQARKDGYVFINWGVKVEDDGIHWDEVRASEKKGTMKQLVVTMTPEAWIEGRALDAETGQPVRVDRIVRCLFERKPGGEVVLNSCWSATFEQPEVGRFRIPYGYPDEYHLTVSAAGYHDGEAFTPKVSQLQPVAGIEVKLRRKREGTVPDVAQQTISGTVSRHGQRVTSGWVGLIYRRHDEDPINSYMLRGRTVVGLQCANGSAPLLDGAYTLKVPFQDDEWYVAAEEPGQPLTLIGPIKVELNEKKHLDIECVDGGSIHGRVKNVPNGWGGNLWAVAFTKSAIQTETPVNADGSFSFSQLPPGEYGLKVGHDAYLDSEVPRGKSAMSNPALRDQKADPWQRAVIATVRPGGKTSGVELELPAREGNSDGDD